MGRNDAVSINPSTWGQPVKRSITSGRTHYRDPRLANREPATRHGVEVEIDAAEFEQRPGQK
jgi:hypothetical protein